MELGMRTKGVGVWVGGGEETPQIHEKLLGIHV